MKRLEFDLQVESNQKRAFEGEVDRLNTKISEMEEEDRDRVNESFSQTEREYEYIRQLDKLRAQNEMNLLIIQQLTNQS